MEKEYKKLLSKNLNYIEFSYQLEKFMDKYGLNNSKIEYINLKAK